MPPTGLEFFVPPVKLPSFSSAKTLLVGNKVINNIIDIFANLPILKLFQTCLTRQISCSDNYYMGKNKTNYYDSSSLAESRTIDSNELNDIIENSAKGFDSILVTHLVRRFQLTILENNRKYQELIDFIEKIRHEKELDQDPFYKVSNALPLLTIEEQRKILDENYLSELEKLKAEQHFAQQIQIIITNDINRIKSLLGTLSNDKNIPESIISEINKIYDQIKSYKTVRNFNI